MQDLSVRVKKMISETFDNYLEFAYPSDELKPISCIGHKTLGNYSLTLIDSLDTLLIIGDHDRFFHALELLRDISFDQDMAVSVFETNIRVLGFFIHGLAKFSKIDYSGLLSAYLVASKKIPSNHSSYHLIPSILEKAKDIGTRLARAFETKSGIPYGTVNLKRGIPVGETPVVCVACASTFSMEFGWLSILTQNHTFYEIAKKSVRAIYQARSASGLLGSHINAKTQQFAYFESGISGGIDSFYEYLVKSWILFGDEEYASIYQEMLHGVKRNIRHPSGWYLETDLGGAFNGQISSLAAFWPGLQVLAGDVKESMNSVNMYAELLTKIAFIPEFYDLANMQFVKDRAQYPLRPEYIESLWYVYRATKDHRILLVAEELLKRIEKFCKTKCGYADIKNVETMEKSDSMQSFFLSETLKYFYLLFNEESEFNGIEWIMTTEAHLLPITRNSVLLGQKYSPISDMKCSKLYETDSHKERIEFEKKHIIWTQYKREVQKRRVQRSLQNKCTAIESLHKSKIPLDCALEQTSVDLSLSTGQCSLINYIISKELNLWTLE